MFFCLFVLICGLLLNQDRLVALNYSMESVVTLRYRDAHHMLMVCEQISQISVSIFVSFFFFLNYRALDERRFWCWPLVNDPSFHVMLYTWFLPFQFLLWLSARWMPKSLKTPSRRYFPGLHIIESAGIDLFLSPISTLSPDRENTFVKMFSS